MGTAIRMAPWASMMVIFLTIVYMYYRHKSHTKNQSERMYEFGSVVMKETGIPIKDPRIIKEQANQEYDKIAAEVSFPYDSEVVTWIYDLDKMKSTRSFVWVSEDHLYVFPTKEVCKDVELIERGLVKVIMIDIKAIQGYGLEQTDDVLEEITSRTCIKYDEAGKSLELYFGPDDITTFKFLLTDLLHE